MIRLDNNQFEQQIHQLERELNDILSEHSHMDKPIKTARPISLTLTIDEISNQLFT